MRERDDQLTQLALLMAQMSERMKTQELAQQSTENMDEWYLAFEMWFTNQYTAPDADHTLYLIVWDAEEQQWFGYAADEGLYKPLLTEDIEAIVKNWADDAGIKTTPSRFNHGLNRLRLKLRFREEWDDTTYLNFKNGIYLLKSKEFVAHDPMYRSRYQLGVSYQPTIQPTPCWDKIRAVYPTQLGHFESFLLASLYQDFSNEGLYFGVGKTGSGKGTIAQILQQVYGNGIANVLLDELNNDKFGLVPLLGKRINLNREMVINTLHSKVVGFLKDVVTHEGPIDVNEKNKNRFMHWFNIWFFNFTNQLPRLPEGTDRTAWFRRTIIDVYDKTQTKDPEFKDQVKLETSAIVSNLLHLPYTPIITKDTNIDELVRKNAELWDFWSDPIKRVILRIFAKSTDPNERLDTQKVWDIVDEALKAEQHDLKYQHVQNNTTTYLQRIGVRKVNRKWFQPIKIIDPEILKQLTEDNEQIEAQNEDRPCFEKLDMGNPKNW